MAPCVVLGDAARYCRVAFFKEETTHSKKGEGTEPKVY